jgi:hypothetical protein
MGFELFRFLRQLVVGGVQPAGKEIDPEQAWIVAPKSTQCPRGFKPFGTLEFGGFCCGGANVSTDGEKCMGGEICAFPSTPRRPDSKWTYCTGTSQIQCPVKWHAYGG